jgi:hypothetical protein
MEQTFPRWLLGARLGRMSNLRVINSRRVPEFSGFRSLASSRLDLGHPPRLLHRIFAVGTSADNALAESFNAALKREVLQDNTCWPDAATCRREVFRWLARYNTKRRHSHCRNLSPANYERTHTPATLPEAA